MRDGVYVVSDERAESVEPRRCAPLVLLSYERLNSTFMAINPDFSHSTFGVPDAEDHPGSFDDEEHGVIRLQLPEGRVEFRLAGKADWDAVTEELEVEVPPVNSDEEAQRALRFLFD